MQGFNFNRLHYFHVVASMGSQAAAARHLNVSQSTISEQLKLLENELGTQLFERSAGGMKLTPAGRKCFEHTEVMFNAGNRLWQEIRGTPNSRTVLELGVASSVSRWFATHLFLPLFSEETIFPRIRQGSYPQLLQQLASSELDLLLTDVEPRPRSSERMVTHVAARPNLIVVGSPPLASSVGEFPSDLVGKPFVMFTEASALRWPIEAFFREHAIVPSVVAETDDSDLARLAAVEGHALAVLPADFVKRDIDRGDLVKVGPLAVEATVYLAYLEQQPSEKIRRAAELLTRALTASGSPPTVEF